MLPDIDENERIREREVSARFGMPDRRTAICAECRIALSLIHDSARAAHVISYHTFSESELDPSDGSSRILTFPSLDRLRIFAALCGIWWDESWDDLTDLRLRVDPRREMVESIPQWVERTAAAAAAAMDVARAGLEPPDDPWRTAARVVAQALRDAGHWADPRDTAVTTVLNAVVNPAWRRAFDAIVAAGVPRCMTCGDVAPRERAVYATPVCHTCLPPPEPLDVIEAPDPHR